MKSNVIPTAWNMVVTIEAKNILDSSPMLAITSMATLSFLGLGVQAPNADWGTLLRDGMGNLYNSSALLFIPAICVILVTVSINLFSDGVQNYLDPSSRKLPSFKKYEKKHGIKKLSAVKANGEA